MNGWKNPVRRHSRNLVRFAVWGFGAMLAWTGSSHAGQRIVFLGDSITQAGNLKGGYVALVREQLASPDCEIVGAGISGNKVPDLLARLDGDVLSKKPTKVVIYIGINDVWHSQNGKGTPVEQFRAGLIELIGKIRSSGAEVLLCTPSVIGEKSDGSNPLDGMLDEYCAVGRQVAAETKTPLLDLRRRFLTYLAENNPDNAEKGVLTTDGVHLNPRGNRFVAEQMLGALQMSESEETGRVYRHVVLFAFKPDATAEQIDRVVEAFGQLPDKIDTIIDFESGIDSSVEEKAKGFTHAFVVTFRDPAGRDAYLPHPAHQEFVQLVRPVLKDVLVIDYWADRPAR